MDSASDIDLYVFAREAVPLPARQALVAVFGASRADLGLAFWDPGDEWIHAETGIEVDVVYWDTRWIADQVAREIDVWRRFSDFYGYEFFVMRRR